MKIGEQIVGQSLDKVKTNIICICDELYLHPLLLGTLQDFPYLRTPNEIIQVLCFSTVFRDLVLHPQIPSDALLRSISHDLVPYF